MKSVLLTVGILAAVAPAFPSSSADAAARERRVAEIAAHLAPHPHRGEILPIIYDRLAAVPSEQRRKGLLAGPLPSCPGELYLRFAETGERANYDRAFHRLQTVLLDLAMAADATGDAQCLAAVDGILRRVCDMKSWLLPSHDRPRSKGEGPHDVFDGKLLQIDLGCAHLSFSLAFVLQLLDGRLPPATVARVRAELERRVFAVYRRVDEELLLGRQTPFTRRHWWFYGKSNWNAVCHAGVVRAALVFYDDRTERARFVESAERAMPSFLQSFLADGYCTEGMGYWNYGFGNFLVLTEAVRAATGGFVDFSRLATADRPMRYALNYRLAAPAYAPRFADGGSGWPAAGFVDLGLRYWPELAPLAKAELPPHSEFPAAQVYISRQPRLQFAVKGGTNGELHNHNDLGSWTLIVDGEELAGDPGGEVYTARTFSKDRYVSKVLNSYGHPVPRLDGELQAEGAGRAARVLAVEFADRLDRIVLDLTGGYPKFKQAGGRCVRTVVVTRGDRPTVTISDHVTAKRPVTAESAVVTCVSSVAETAGRTWLVQGKKAGIVAVPKAEGSAWSVVRDRIENPGRADVTRLAVKTAAPVTEATLSWRFELP